MRFDFPTLSKVSGTLRVVLHLDSEVLLVYLARLGVRAPIPYVQDAILNLRHPYIVIATAMTDYVAQLSLSQTMAFNWLFAVLFSCGTTPYVLNMQKLVRNYWSHF